MGSLDDPRALWLGADLSDRYVAQFLIQVVTGGSEVKSKPIWGSSSWPRRLPRMQSDGYTGLVRIDYSFIRSVIHLGVASGILLLVQ